MNTRKNTYVTPLLKGVRVKGTMILAGSVYSVNGIKYGGKDTEGVLDPSSLDVDFGMEDSDY